MFDNSHYERLVSAHDAWYLVRDPWALLPDGDTVGWEFEAIATYEWENEGVAYAINNEVI